MYDNIAFQLFEEDETNPSRDCAGRKKFVEIPDRILYSPVYDDELLDTYMSIIVNNIKDEIAKRDISLNDLSQLANVSIPHLSSVISGKKAIGLRVLIRLMVALQLSPSEVFPSEIIKRRTNGDRFDELTKGLDTKSNNFLLSFVADYVNLYKNL